MKEIADILDILPAGEYPVLAVVTAIGGSAVRGTGAVMALSGDGTLMGSISGGCIESAVVQAAGKLFEEDEPRLLRFCAIDDELFGSFSPCGGEISVMVYRGSVPVIRRCRELQEAGKGALWGVALEGGEEKAGLSFAGEDMSSLVFSDGRSAVPAALASVFESASPAERAAGFCSAGWFVAFLPPPVRLCVVGGGHIAVPLSAVGRAMGWKTAVIDPRDLFMGKGRFSHADRVMNMWPEPAFRELGLDSRSAVAAVSHDEKIDDQAAAAALEAGCFYVGVLGSRRTLAERKKRLAARGVPQTRIDLLRGPIGLDIGARTPEEIALATAAQIVETLNRSRR